MRKFKKLTAVLICAAMLLALVPAMSVGAAEIVDSGTHGDKLTWTLDRNERYSVVIDVEVLTEW